MSAGAAVSAGPDRAPGVLARVTRDPWGSALRLGVVGLSSIGAAWVHQDHDPGALCPLRRLTGVPCPFCGSTTVFMEAGAGHWSAALAANPVTVLAAMVFLAAPLLAVDPIMSLLRVPPRLLWIAGSVLMAASWLWELHRFGFLT